MEKSFSVFYSWQMDTNAKFNKNLINDCIKNAIKQNTKFIEVERDTKNVQGAIDIAKVIFDKIEKCDVFIADVTLVGKYKKGRIFNKNIKYVPNCNVMLELGYAAAILSWERVILVFNEKYGRPDDLPFDLRQHRLITYNSETESLAAVRKSLSNELKSIIDDYFKSGPVLKKDNSFICLKGYDYSKNCSTDKLIGYKFDEFPQIHNVESKIEIKIKSICKELKKYNIGERQYKKPMPVVGNQMEQLSARIYNEQKEDFVEPNNVEEVISKLHDYFSLDFEYSDFQFGSLKYSTFPQIALPGFSSGPNVIGTDDEKNKYYKYNELLRYIKIYEILLKNISIFRDYYIYPIVIYNESKIKDSNIEIDIYLDKNIETLCSKQFISNNEMKDLYLLHSEDLINQMFFNYVYSNQITTESVPIKFEEFNEIGFPNQMDDYDIKNVLESTLMDFYDSHENKEYEILINSLRSQEKKWATKLLIVRNVKDLRIEYVVKSDKSIGDIRKRI